MIRVANPLRLPGNGATTILPPGPHTFYDEWVSPRIVLFRDLWDELHSKANPTQEWFDDWISRVPQFGCGCQAWLRDYIVSHPPRFDDWPRWTWQVHNAVNAKLRDEGKDRPEFSWADFAAKYP